VHFAEVVYRADDILTPAMTALHAAVTARRPTPGWMEEQFYDLLGRMLLAHRGVAREMARLPVIRRSTRVELYRRLARGRDFIEDSTTRQIGLAAMAGAANMAPHHFLRLYKRAFGRTPHQHLTALRIERARHLLATTGESVTQICLDLGFESPTSFAHLFKRQTGLTPTQYRASGIHNIR
jgi:AraC-like DNA-binding protein